MTIAGVVKEAVTIVPSYWENILYHKRNCGTPSRFILPVNYSPGSGYEMSIGNFSRSNLVAVFYFHDDFTWLKGVVLFTIMIGFSLFNWYKYQKLRKGQTSEDLVVSYTLNVAAEYVILEEMDDPDNAN